MSNDKTLGHAVRYEWFSASEQWSACDHSEAQKLSAAGYEVREVRGFRMDCTCPSGDGSLRHPCPAHPATLATAKHGGCVQLGGRLPEAVAKALAIVNEAANDARHAGDYKVANALVTARVTLSKQLLALSAQPSPGGQGDERRCAEHCQNGRADVCLASQRDGIICPEDSCDIDDGIRHNHVAARQPVGETATWRYNSAAVDSKALATATEIALMWGKDRSQFVSRIQAAVIDAMQWMNGGLLEKPAQAEDLGQFRGAVLAMADASQNDLTDERYDEAMRLLSLIDNNSEVQ